MADEVQTIFDHKMILVYTSNRSDTILIRKLSVEDLRSQNAGFPEFIRGVLHETAILGGVYDDSDYQSDVYCWYFPVDKVRIEGFTTV